jgi:hypothetical protein
MPKVWQNANMRFILREMGYLLDAGSHYQLWSLPGRLTHTHYILGLPRQPASSKYPILRDLRYGLRSLRLQPGFSALAIMTLALGIGGATTMFSVIDNVLLNPFPYKDPHRIATF